MRTTKDIVLNIFKYKSKSNNITPNPFTAPLIKLLKINMERKKTALKIRKKKTITEYLVGAMAKIR